MRSWRVWIGFLISLFFLWLAFRGQDLSEIWTAIRAADYIWLAPAIIIYFLGVGVRTVRWAYLLRPLQRIHATELFPIVTIGYMANNVLPLRTGEIVRAYALSNRHGVRKSGALATIAIERVFDGLTMLLFILIASISVALTGDLATVAELGALLFAILTALLLVIVFAPNARDRLLGRLFNILPDSISSRLAPIVAAFIEGLGILRRRNELISVTVMSIIAWLLEASVYLIIAQAFGIDFSMLAALMVTAVANLATLVPSSPGYVGAFEYGVVLVVNGALGYARELALSYALVVHAALFIPVTIAGAIYWWRESLSWGQARKSSDPATTQPEAPTAQ